MRIAEVVFQHQLAVQAALVVGVALVAEGAVKVVLAAGGQLGQVGVVLAVEEDGVLHVSICTVGVY